ncbi:MAG: hypothetical protein KBS81_10640, partial [Spirochaetales bacterium]|nr:hypothetical protein [Candidatus Physcosoma equi]
MRRITVSDCTLRKLSENGASQLLFREKLALALCIDRYGADVIELPAVRNPKEDKIIYKTISDSVKNAVVAVPVGISVEGVKAVADMLKGAPKTKLIVSVPVSTVQMEYLYHMKGPKMVEKVKELCAAARSYSEDVEFEALDATRCEVEFLLEIAKAAKDSGATSVALSDDAGIMLPGEFAELVTAVKKAVDLPVVVSPSDKISLATANAVASLQSGAEGIKASVVGKDALILGSAAEALKSRGESIGVSCGLKFTELHSDIESMLKKIQSSKTEEEVDAAVSGAVFLDATCTAAQVKDATVSLGYDLSEEDVGKVQAAIVRLCEKKSSIGSKELEAVVASSAMQVPATYTLTSYLITSSNLTSSVANVILQKDGGSITGLAQGDGPIDSAFKAIEGGIGYHYELDDFQIQAVTEGKEALGSSLVRLRSKGRLYSGTGLST